MTIDFMRGTVGKMNEEKNHHPKGKEGKGKISQNGRKTLFVSGTCYQARRGFEPRSTDSESVVLTATPTSHPYVQSTDSESVVLTVTPTSHT
jgi:hypothetical protein